MNAQEIFDKVVAHLNKQGHRAISDTGRCVYRATNGDMCAVGCLLGDMYVPEMDPEMDTDMGHGAQSLIETFNLPFADHVSLLRDLQQCHDYAADIVRELTMVAKNHNLQFDPQAITNWSVDQPVHLSFTSSTSGIHE